MGTQYIDPIDGLDTNDGLAEITPVKTMEQALINAGFTIDTQYTKSISNSGATDTFIFLQGITLLTKGLAITSHLYSSSNPTYYTNFYGMNGAILKNVSGEALWDFTEASYQSGSTNYNFYGRFEVRHLNIINNPSLSNIAVSSGLHSAGIIKNVSCKGCTFNAGCNISATSLVHDAVAPNKFALANYCTNDYVTSPTGYIKTAPAQTSLGNGAFLPAPNNDMAWLPRAAIDFQTQGWLDDSSYGGGRPLIAHSYIVINTGTSCRVLSPVVEYPKGIDFTVHFIDSIEDDTLGADHNEVIDSTTSDVTRTIEVRASTSTFGQEDASPTWVTIEKNASHNSIIGKFIQFRITLTSIGK